MHVQRCSELESAAARELEMNDVGIPNDGLDRERLLQVQSLEEALGLFGIQHGDRIDTRELVIYTSLIETDMREAKAELQEQGRYEEAAKVRDRLASLRQEFMRHQTSVERERQLAERSKFERAAARIQEANEADFAKAGKELERICSRRRKDLLHAHEVQTKNLEDFISNMHRPRVRYTKGLLDMMHSEKHLCNLDQFEDARALNRRIAQCRPEEIARHERVLKHKEQVLRRNLTLRQEFEWTKLNEKLHDLCLRHDRNCAVTRAQSSLRLRNHERDMAHRHLAASQMPERFCAVRGGKVRPVVPKRKNYLKTDAAFRGSQLLASARGDAIKNVVSLCAIHDFAGPQYEEP